MTKLYRVPDSLAAVPIKPKNHILEPLEIRLIMEGRLDRLVDFASSSRLYAADPKGDSPLWTCNGLVPVTYLSLCPLCFESQGAYAA